MSIFKAATYIILPFFVVSMCIYYPVRIMFDDNVLYVLVFLAGAVIGFIDVLRNNT